MRLQAQILSLEERQQAHQLWDALMFAPTQADLDLAYQQLLAVSDSVRNAIAWASVARETHLHVPRRDENPFD